MVETIEIKTSDEASAQAVADLLERVRRLEARTMQLREQILNLQAERGQLLERLARIEQ